MCGRYSLHANPEVVSLLFGLSFGQRFGGAHGLPQYCVSIQ